MFIAALTLGLCAVEACAVAKEDGEREARRARILERIKTGVVTRAEELARPGTAPVRDMTNTALGVLVAGEDPRLAENLLSHAFSLQDMKRNSPTYGYIPWTEGDKDIKLDPNSIEFATHSMGPILLLYGDKLSEPFKREMKRHISAAFSALRMHHPPVWYTNIFLMNTINMILMGEAVGDKKAANDGYAQLDIWLDYTREAGIHEYDSPVYYAVDLDTLGIGYRLAQRPEGKAKLKSILDCFWSDMCASFFPANGHLSGPQSRNYNFLGDTGGLNAYYWLEGMIGGEGGGSAYMYLGSAPEGYRPDPKILALSKVPERVIVSRWDTRPGGTRYAYMTRDLVIGGANKYYEPQDRPISIELASKKNLPVMTVTVDSFDSPYGKARIVDACGHSKPFHWPLNPTCVQEKGTMMILAALNPAGIKSWERGRRDKAVPVESLATNVILPARADSVLIDGKTVSPKAPFEIEAGPGSVVGVREGKAGVAIRVFAANGCAGFDPAYKLQAEAHGLESDAFRYSVYHYQGEPKKLKEASARVGLIIVATPCKDDAELAKLMETVKKASLTEYRDLKTWQVKATVGNLTLEAGVDVRSREPLYRRVNGKPMPDERLMVNGVDLADKTLGGLQ